MISQVDSWTASGDPADIIDGLTDILQTWLIPPVTPGRLAADLAKCLGEVEEALRQGSCIPQQAEEALSELILAVDFYWADRTAMPPSRARVVRSLVDVCAAPGVAGNSGLAEELASVLRTYWLDCATECAADEGTAALVREVSAIPWDAGEVPWPALRSVFSGIEELHRSRATASRERSAVLSRAMDVLRAQWSRRQRP